MEQIILIPSNNEKIYLSKDAAIQSKLLETLINDLPEDDKPIFTFYNIKYEILKKIVGYLNHYCNNKPKEINRVVAIYDFESEMSEWDIEYTNIDINLIIDLIYASNLLEIKSLIELLTIKLDSIMMRKNPDLVNKLINKNDNNNMIDEKELFNEIV